VRVQAPLLLLVLGLAPLLLMQAQVQALLLVLARVLAPQLQEATRQPELQAKNALQCVFAR
jgi:hypothetical protein